MKNNGTRQTYYILITVLIMLITSRFVVRIIDATVQIDDDICLIVILLLALNAVIGMLSHKLYKKTNKKPGSAFNTDTGEE